MTICSRLLLICYIKSYLVVTSAFDSIENTGISGIFTTRKRSLGQSNIFTSVCLFTGDLHPGGLGRPPLPKAEHYAIRSTSGWFASYWNAFLLCFNSNYIFFYFLWHIIIKQYLHQSYEWFYKHIKANKKRRLTVCVVGDLEKAKLSRTVTPMDVFCCMWFVCVQIVNRGVLFLLKFGIFSPERKETRCLGTTETEVWVGNFNVKARKTIEHKLHKIWHSLKFCKISGKQAHPWPILYHRCVRPGHNKVWYIA